MPFSAYHNKFINTKQIRKISIKKRLWLLYFLQMLILAIVLIFVTVDSVNDNVKVIETQNDKSATALSYELEKQVSALDNATQYPLMSTSGVTSVFQNYLSTLDTTMYNDFVNEFMGSTQYLFDTYDNLRLFLISDINGKYYYKITGEHFTYSLPDSQPLIATLKLDEANWYSDVQNSRGNINYFSHEDMPTSSVFDSENNIYAVRTVYDLYNKRNVGVVLAGVNLNYLANMYNDMAVSEDSLFYVTDDSDKYMWGNIEADELSVIDSQYLVTQNSFSDGFKIYICTPYSYIYQNVLNQTYILFVLLIVASLVIMIFISKLIKSIRSPIDKLVDACTEIKGGELSTVIEDEGNDEFSLLAQSFNDMSKENKRLIDEVLQKDLMKSKIEIRMLRAQINPHFLYNTLDSIRSVALVKGEEDLAKMSSLLADNLRFGVGDTSPMVTVEEEINNLYKYIELQRLRYRDKVRFEVHIQPQIMSIQILKLLLQPVVENSLVHAMSGMSDNNTITVLGSISDDIITFQVIDNGVGMDQQKINDLTDYINGKNQKFKSVGLKNIQRRIQLYYGQEYGMSFNSSPNSGTLVTIKIPKNIIES